MAIKTKTHEKSCLKTMMFVNKHIKQVQSTIINQRMNMQKIAKNRENISPTRESNPQPSDSTCVRVGCSNRLS